MAHVNLLPKDDVTHGCNIELEGTTLSIIPTNQKEAYITEWLH